MSKQVRLALGYIQQPAFCSPPVSTKSGLHVELLGDVFTDFNQIAATLIALAGGRFMPVLDARQVIRQWLATGASARQPGGIGFGGAVDLLDFRLNKGDIGEQGVFEQTKRIRRRCASSRVSAWILIS